MLTIFGIGRQSPQMLRHGDGKWGNKRQGLEVPRNEQIGSEIRGALLDPDHPREWQAD
jgi:hypothetical protein